MVRLQWILLVVIVTSGSAACGKRGDPLAPLRPIPGRVADVTATRVDDRVELRFTIPAANADGSTPPAVDRLDVFGLGTAAGAAAPTPDQIAADAKNLRAQLTVPRGTDQTARPAAPPAATQSPAAAPVEAGSPATLVDRLDPGALAAAGVTSMHYVVRGIAGTGRGRPGPWSAVLSVPISALVSSPIDLRVTYDETNLTLAWTAAGEGLAYRVFEVQSDAAGGAASGAAPVPLTAAPITTAELKTAVEFGRTRCFAVRPVRVTGSVRVDGALSAPACATPADTFAPAAPGELRVVQEGAAITLLWAAVEAGDLAGYRVLRGEGADAVLRQLTREPVAATTYTDAAVTPGSAYTYSVVAVDKAGNLSTQSNRQTVTVR